MNKIRKQFEDRSDIKVRLDLCLYDENLGAYRSKSSKEYATAAYLNGAWYAFQEQQKKIDEFVNIINDAYKSDGNSSVETVYDKIQELLK